MNSMECIEIASMVIGIDAKIKAMIDRNSKRNAKDPRY